MSEVILSAEVREGTGKANAGRLRRTGRVPAIIYGEIDTPAPISVDAHTLKLLLRERHSLINVDLSGKKHRVVVRDVQYHPVSSDVIHIDFMEVKKGSKLSMAIPVSFEGKPKGVKEGGILDIIRHEVEIEVLPKDIPNEITINIDNLEIGDSVRVEDLKADKFELLDDPDTILCRVEAPRAIEEEAPSEEEEEEEMAEPEVITARDSEEESAE